MKMRVVIKIGDVFAVENLVFGRRYLQVISRDLNQLSSDVVRVFKRADPITSELPDIAEIVFGEIDFHAHTTTSLGVKLALWKKVGHTKSVSNVETVLFRGTPDFGVKLGEALIKVSKNWHIWRVNDEGRTDVGELVGEFRAAEIGIVFPPFMIVDRMVLGQYKMSYPGFE
jgi:hypothetical protein